MKQIFLDWWHAHLLEFIVSGATISLIILIFIGFILVDFIKGKLK